MAVSKMHCDLMRKVGDYVPAQWEEHCRFIAGKSGYAAAHYQSVKSSHPAFPIFMYSLGIIPALSNGAQVTLAKTGGSRDPSPPLSRDRRRVGPSQIGGVARSSPSRG